MSMGGCAWLCVLKALKNPLKRIATRGLVVFRAYQCLLMRGSACSIVVEMAGAHTVLQVSVLKGVLRLVLFSCVYGVLDNSVV